MLHHVQYTYTNTSNILQTWSLANHPFDAIRRCISMRKNFFSCLYRLLQVDRKFTDIFYTFTISLLGEYNPLVILIEIYRDLVTHTIPEIKIHKKYQFMIYSLKYIYYFLKYNYLCLSNKLNVNAINICYSKSKVIFFVNFSRYSFFI